MRTHHAKARHSVAHARMLMRELKAKRELKRKDGLKKKLWSGISKLSANNMSRHLTMSEKLAFNKQQAELKIEAEINSEARHRLPRNNLIVLGDNHESNLIHAKTPNEQDMMNYSKSHDESDFSYSAGIRVNPEAWFVWNPRLGHSSTPEATYAEKNFIPVPPPPLESMQSKVTRQSPRNKRNRRVPLLRTSLKERVNDSSSITAEEQLLHTQTEQQTQQKQQTQQEQQAELNATNATICEEARVKEKEMESQEQAEGQEHDDSNSKKKNNAKEENEDDDDEEEEEEEEEEEKEDDDEEEDDDDEEEEEEEDDHNNTHARMSNGTTHIQWHEHHRKRHDGGSVFQLCGKSASHHDHDHNDKHARKHAGKLHFADKQAYIATVMRQQKVSRKDGAHISVGTLDNRPSTRTGLSGYMVDRLERNLPVEPLKALSAFTTAAKGIANDGGDAVSLELENLGISDVLFQSVTSALKTSHLAKSERGSWEAAGRNIFLNVKGNRIGIKGLQALLSCFQHFPNGTGYLSQIAFDRNKLTGCGSEVGDIMLSCSLNLIEVTLSSCGITDDFFRSVGSRFQRKKQEKEEEEKQTTVGSAPETAATVNFPHLKLIDLSDNKMGDRGLLALVNDVLPTTPCLTSLDLHSNRMSSKGAIALFDGLASLTPRLHSLNLSNNAIGSDSFRDVTAGGGGGGGGEQHQAGEALRDLLQENHTLAHLRIESCAFDVVDLEEIAAGVVRSSSLLCVHLAGNPRHSSNSNSTSLIETNREAGEGWDNNEEREDQKQATEETLDRMSPSPSPSPSSFSPSSPSSSNAASAIISAVLRSQKNASTLMIQHVTTPHGKRTARLNGGVEEIDSLLFTRELGAGKEAAQFREAECCWICENWRSHTILSHSLEEASETIFSTTTAGLTAASFSEHQQNGEDGYSSSSSFSSSSSSSSDEDEDDLIASSTGGAAAAAVAKRKQRLNKKERRTQISALQSRRITLVYPHHHLSCTRTMQLDPGTEKSPRYHLSILLPVGRTIFFFNSILLLSNPASNDFVKNESLTPPIYCVDSDQPQIVAPVWIQQQFKLSHVNYYDMAPPREKFDGATHSFVKEESILHDLVPSDENSIAALIHASGLFNTISLVTVLDVADDDDAIECKKVLLVLEKNISLLAACYQYACCYGEVVESVVTLACDGWCNMLSKCHVIDNQRIRVQDLTTVFRSMCKESAAGRHARKNHKHRHRTPSPVKAKAKVRAHQKKKNSKKQTNTKKVAKAPQQLEFLSFLVAIVRTAILKYGGGKHDDETEAVRRFINLHLFQAGQILLEPFRQKWLYSSSTYECLHEHEGLINALHRRFSNKHLTKEETEHRKEEYRKKKRRKKKKKGKTTEGEGTTTTRLNLLEFIDLMKTTRTIHVSSTSGDRRQCTRQELTYIFRASSGPDPLPRGLTLPQFLDAVSRCAMLIAFRKSGQKDANVAFECYPHLGVHVNGGAIVVQDDRDYSSDNGSNSNYSDEEDNDEATADDPASNFIATLSLSQAIEKYIIPHWNAFTKHG